MLKRIKSLVFLRRTYLDELTIFIESNRFLSFFANIVIIFAVLCKRQLAKVFRFARKNSKINPLFFSQDRLNQPRSIPAKPDVLLIVEDSLAHCFRYRVQQKIEQLESVGIKVRWIAWTNALIASQMMHFAHIIIFYRVPAYDTIIQLMKKAQALNKITFYDVDDLIFDTDIMRENIAFFSDLSSQEQRGMISTAELYRQAINHCDFAIGSTPMLCRQLDSLKPAFLHRNGLDKEILDFIEKPLEKQANIEHSTVSLFYGSGSKTHNHDFDLIKKPLLETLQNYPQVRLIIIGHLRLPPEFEPYQSRIDRIDILKSEAYWHILHLADINLAPLQAGVFTDSKSEIKWIEASIMKIPSIVSPTQTYKEILENGKTAFLAQSDKDWSQYLSELITKPELRIEMANNAYQYVMEHYHPDKGAKQLQTIFSQARTLAKQKVANDLSPKKIIFVHAFFPESAGETSNKNQLLSMLNEFNLNNDKNLTIEVFSIISDTDLPAYHLKEHFIDELHVTTMALPREEDKFKIDQFFNVFEQFLNFQQAQLVHINRLSVLSSSLMDYIRQKQIPHIVSVTDTWWLCERKNMINSDDRPCPQRHINPFICAKCVTDANYTIQRNVALFERLSNADKRITGSEELKDLYQANDLELEYYPLNDSDKQIYDVHTLVNLYSSLL